MTEFTEEQRMYAAVLLDAASNKREILAMLRVASECLGSGLAGVSPFYGMDDADYGELMKAKGVVDAMIAKTMKELDTIERKIRE